MTQAQDQIMRSLLFVLALITCAMPSAAQTYTFASCQKNVTLTVKINSVVSQSGPNPDGQGGHSTNLIFFGDFALTMNGSTQTISNTIAAANIGYTPTIGNLTT